MMLFRLFSYDGWLTVGGRMLRHAVFFALVLGLYGLTNARSQEAVSADPKHVIGATATITEASTGIAFSTRIDTGAKSCSLHIEKMEIEDESPKRLHNIGKKVRFLIKGENGKSAWIETTIA
ncbi:MAG TPA: hypothetical protein VHK01_17915, partial [Lacipirellulaceae bacterium]|nr:hypothetical protein [Lacipirellulaceae bacterium]